MYREVSNEKFQKILDAMYACNPLAQSANVFTGNFNSNELFIPSEQLYLKTTNIIRETCGTIDEQERNDFLYGMQSDEVYMMLGKFTAEYRDEIDDDGLINSFIEDLMRYIVVAGTVMY